MQRKDERDVQSTFWAIAAQLSQLLDANPETAANEDGAKMTVKIMCDTGVIPILSTDYHQIFANMIISLRELLHRRWSNTAKTGRLYSPEKCWQGSVRLRKTATPTITQKWSPSSSKNLTTCKKQGVRQSVHKKAF